MMIAAVTTALVDIEFTNRATTTAAEEFLVIVPPPSYRTLYRKDTTNLVSNVYIAK